MTAINQRVRRIGFGVCATAAALLFFLLILSPEPEGKNLKVKNPQDESKIEVDPDSTTEGNSSSSAPQRSVSSLKRGNIHLNTRYVERDPFGLDHPSDPSLVKIDDLRTPALLTPEGQIDENAAVLLGFSAEVVTEINTFLSGVLTLAEAHRKESFEHIDSRDGVETVLIPGTRANIQSRDEFLLGIDRIFSDEKLSLIREHLVNMVVLRTGAFNTSPTVVRVKSNGADYAFSVVVLPNLEGKTYSKELGAFRFR